MSTNTPSTPAGWYPSDQPGQLRYWDGAQWTEHYQPAAAEAPAQAAAQVPQIPQAPQPVSQSPYGQAPAYGQAAPYVQAPHDQTPYGQTPPYAQSAHGQAPNAGYGQPAPAPKKRGLGAGAIAAIVAGAVVVTGGAVWGGIALFGGGGAVAAGCPAADAALFEDLAESGGAGGISAPELADSSALAPEELQSLFTAACVYTASGEVDGGLGAPMTGEMTIALSKDGAVDPTSVADAFTEAGWSDLGALAALGGEDVEGMGMWIDGDLMSMATGDAASMTMAIGMEFEAAKEQMSDEELAQLESSFPGTDYMLVVITTGE